MRKLVLTLMTAVAAAALLGACTDTADDTGSPAPSPGTPAATQPPGGAGGGDLPATVVAPPTPSASVAPIPDDWPTFVDPSGRYSFRYPPTWHPDPLIPEGGEPRVTSWDPTTWDEPYYAPSGILVWVSYGPIGDRSGPPPEATDTSLGGEPAKEFLRTFDSSTDCRGCPPIESAKTREHVIVADHNGYRLYLIGAFAGADPDETTFSQIVSTFSFTE